MTILPPRPLTLLFARSEELLRCMVCRVFLWRQVGYEAQAGAFCGPCYQARYHMN